MKNIPKIIENIILKNMSEINPLGEYSVYCNKHLQTTVLDSKIRHIEVFASKYESEVIITKKERIIGKNRVTDIKIVGFASNLIDEVLLNSKTPKPQMTEVENTDFTWEET